MGTVELKGDFSKLQKLITRLQKFAKGDELPRVAKAMGDEALKMVRMGFRDQTDPYGRPWAPLSPNTKKRRSGRILRRSGTLYRSWALSVGGDMFRVSSSARYAGVHQHGADYTASGRTTFRNKKGRFVKAATAKKNAAKRKRGAVAVSVHGSHRVVIPQRMMFPSAGLGLGTWGGRLLRVARRELKRILKGAY